MNADVKTKTAEREKIGIWMDKGMLAALRAIQANIGIPVSESIRRACRKYLAEKKKKT